MQRNSQDGDDYASQSSLVAPLLEAVPSPTRPDDVLKKDDYHTCQILNIVLDLLTFCIEHHSFQMRTYLVNKNLLKLMLFLLKSKHKFLSLSALRLFRRIVQLKDNMYNNHIMKEQLFVHIAKCFQRNGPKYNLLNSAMLELFEFIRTEDIHMLVADIVENYFDYFKDVMYVKTFTALKLRHDQYLERQKSMHLIGPNANRAATMATIITTSFDDARPSVSQKSTIMTATTALRDARDMDETEEQWFNEVDADDWDDDLPASVELSGDATNNSAQSAVRNENDSPPSLIPKKEKGDDDFVFSPLLKSSSLSPNSSPFRSTSPTAGVSSKNVASKIVIKSLTPTTANALTSSSSVLTSNSPRSTSPLTSPLSPLAAARKGLVDYDDDSSDEEDNQQKDVKSNEKTDQKTSTSIAVSNEKSIIVEGKSSNDSIVGSSSPDGNKLSVGDQKKRENFSGGKSQHHHQSKKQRIDETVVGSST
uniref:Serine/threonine-protein phosphatase 4 regulatory subunit 3-like central domain-containing protein n=1 Tax=Romanomermis culicivorax TaxID=13658 RepID=A0A915KEK1_ROMCU